ncbi:MAG TPA: PQQ-binding-like beta-propeller repeat protein, partial [Tepidisphaeraceae bacterium]|nr:PQQ-binding-like beta-propeller repeat protein [Tepidisphaeraceae bacterium]
MRAAGRTAILWATTVALLCIPVRGENWPSWRGPLGTGVCSEAGLPLRWDQNQNVVWRIPLPDRGNSTPAVWGDSVFITQAVQKDNRRTLMCFDRADGRLRWQSGVTYADAEPTNAQNPYCSASPATDGRHIV